MHASIPAARAKQGMCEPVRRQKTIEVKTRCACERERRSNMLGGAGRGMWCGQCLHHRMGENIDEARHPLNVVLQPPRTP